MSKISNEEIRFAALAVDIVCFRIINNILHVLLGKVDSVHKDKGMLAHIGGLVRPDETAEEAVKRLLAAKAGISEIFFEQLYTFSTVDRDPRGRVVSVAYIALCGEDPQDQKHTTVTEWIPIKEISNLAYDHKEILKVGIERLQSKLEYTNIAQHLLPEEFTFSELQQVYEIVLVSNLDKRNFRKKILATGIIKDTGKTVKKGVMRPAALFRFVSKAQKVINIL